MEPVSFAVGLASILPLIAGAITTSKEYIDTVRSARKSIAALVAELEALQGNVESLHVLLKEDLYEDGSLRFHESSVLLNCSAACEAKLHSLCEKLKQERKGKIYRLLWPFTEKEHQKTIQEIRNFTNWMQFALSIDGCRLLSQTSDCVLEVMGKQLEHFKTVKSLEADTLQVLDLLKEQKLSNEARIEQETKREVLGWISTLKHYQKHQLVQKSRMKDTGSWILKRTEFSQWRDENSMSNVLVCHGIQGSGKTNLA